MKLLVQNNSQRSINVHASEHAHSRAAGGTGFKVNRCSSYLVGARLDLRKMFTFDVLFFFGLNDKNLGHTHAQLIHLVGEILSLEIRIVG